MAQLLKDSAGSPPPQVPEPVAIVGIGCRFPGSANSPAEFWNQLCEGRDAIREVPDDRWSIGSFYDSSSEALGKTSSKWMGIIDGIDQFDFGFFGISPREAASMDPQQRILLETAYEAIEDAGLALEQLQSSPTGVYIGVSTTDYASLQGLLEDTTSIETYTNSGGALSIVANRISWCLDLHGPSLAIDTACSSSMNAIILACHSLWRGESAFALAGGVNIALSPASYIGFTKLSMLSTDGRCKAFDARGNGYVRSEGAGVIVLKPLSRAVADGDRIYATIRGVGANQDGHTSAMVVPGEEAQMAMIRTACACAGVDPGEIQYMEAHGTGTVVGDQIEARAIGRVIGQRRQPHAPLWLGSVKTNIGHTESAAGVAGVIKTALAIHRGQIPGNLHFREPNPHIDFGGLNLRVPTALDRWPAAEGETRLAGVNSFGFGGANAHVVLAGQKPVSADPGADLPAAGFAAKEPPDGAGDAGAGRPSRRIFPLSARSPQALRQRAASFRDFLLGSSGSDGSRGDGALLEDFGFNLAFRRTHHEYRSLLVADSTYGLIRELDALAQPGSPVPAAAAAPGPSRTVFVFSGQGPQWWGMGRQLLREEPVFRRKIEQCDRALAAHADWSLIGELTADEARSRMGETAISQPAIFAIQVALAAWLESKGVRPDAVIGHSVGEVAAAHVAGFYDLETAARVIFCRGYCMDRATSRGGMLALGLSPAEAVELIQPWAGTVSLASLNSPQSVTLSGNRGSLEEIAARLGNGVFSRMLQVEYAFHTSQMDPIREELLSMLEGLRPEKNHLPMVSTVSGEWVGEGGSELDAGYWWKNVRQPVLFSQAVGRLRDAGGSVFVEISPHPVLRTFVSETVQSHRPPEGGTAGGDRASKVLSTLRRGEDECDQLYGALRELYCHGQAPDWKQHYPRQRPVLDLPAYPWQHETCWSENATIRQLRTGQLDHPLLGRRLKTSEPVWEVELSPWRQGSIWDHVIQSHVLFPAAGFIELGLAVAREIHGSSCCVLEEVDLHRAAFIPESGKYRLTLQTVYDPQNSRYRVYGRTNQPESAWVLFAGGTIVPERPTPADYEMPQMVADQGLTTGVSREEFYRQLAGNGFEYGPAFQGVQACWRDNLSSARAEIVAPAQIRHELDSCQYHPGMLDSGIQVFSQAMEFSGQKGKMASVVVPVHIDRIVSYQPFGERVICRVNLFWQGKMNAKAHYHFTTPEGVPCLAMWGFSVQAVDPGQEAGFEGIEDLLYETEWQCQPLPSGNQQVVPYRGVPSPAALARSLEKEFAQIPGYRWRDRYPGLDRDLSAIGLASAWRSLQELGWRPKAGDRFATADLVRQLGVVGSQQWFVNRVLRMMADSGWLSRDGSTWQVISVPQPVDPEATWRQIYAGFPAALADLTLLSSLGQRLTGVLSGTIEPIEVVFPHGSYDQAEHFYQDSPAYRFYNQLAARSVARAVANAPAGRRVRVLEIGAGTGGTTRYVLPHLDAERTEYVFSDISAGFFPRARQKLGDYSFVDFRVLDIEQDPVEQGFSPHSFDLVLANDAIHAVAELRVAYANILKLMAPGGLMILVETDRQPEWADLIFGLLDGWTRFRDHDLRVDSPILPRGGMVRLQAEMGFVEPVGISDCDGAVEPSHTLYLAGAPPLAGTSVGESPESQSSGLPVPDAARGGRNGDWWLLFADGRGIAAEAGKTLAERGLSVIRVAAGDRFERFSGDSFAVRPSGWGVDESTDFQRLLQEVAADRHGGRLAGVIYAWALDTRSHDAITLDWLAESEQRNCHGLVHLLQALVRMETPSLPVWVLTAGAQPCGGGEGEWSLDQAPLLGVVRTMATELPQFICRSVDLPAEPGSLDLLALAREMEEPGQEAELEVVIRQGARFVPRMVRAPLGRLGPQKHRRPVDPGKNAIRLEIETPGILDRLVLREVERTPPAADQVEVRVMAAGLNFRDVMKAMGIYPTELNEDLWLGDECSGVITAVGSDVRGWSVGDEVVAFAPGAFGSFLRASTRQVFRKPARFGFEESATLAAAFMTSWYALVHLGQLAAGDRVLIQTATGGVGLAALQIARHFGAEVIATAGTPGKRELLRSLGVEHVFDSRSLRFSDRVRAVTGGRGVDLVLNALAGQAIDQGLRCLAPHGRFLEIGKRDIYANNRIGLRNFKDNLSFLAIDMEKVFVDRPGTAAGLWRDLAELFDQGKLHPLPHRVFPVTDGLGCFRAMAQARHVGKLVLSMNESAVPVLPKQPPPWSVDPAGTVLIAGGYSGLGAEFARWLAGRGAKHLVLLGRRGAATPGAGSLIRELGELGVCVTAAEGDITRRGDVDRVLADIARSAAPLRGVIHSVLDLADATILNMSSAHFQAGTGAKTLGAWNLHLATRSLPLDFFVMCSSFSAQVGNPGQCNYSACNAFLDQLAHQRRKMGLPGSVINWGPFGGFGYVAERREMAEGYARIGFTGVNSIQATRILEQCLTRDAVQVTAVHVNWSVLSSVLFRQSPLRLSRLLGGTAAEKGAGFGKFRDSLMSAPAAERLELAIGYLAGELALVLGRNAEDIDHDTSLSKLGFDSLMTVELKNRIEQEAVVSIPVMELMNGPSLRQLAAVLLRQIEGTGSAGEAAAAVVPAIAGVPSALNGKDTGQLLDRLHQMPEDEIDALLAEVDPDGAAQSGR